MLSFLTAAIAAGTPLVFATLGELITEKAGKLNLGVEGMMLLGAVAGFAVGLWTKSPVLALICAAGAGALGALVYAFLTVTLRTNQVVTGLALTTFGGGLSGFFGSFLFGEKMPENIAKTFAPVKIPLLGDIPYIGEVLFTQDVFVYLGYIASVLLGIYLYKTRTGLNLRAVGENTKAADAAGIGITKYKYMHILLGGALCGLGGAYLSVVEVGQWQEYITAGRGWIAIALVIFCNWNPFKALICAFFFGGLNILGFRIQSLNISQNLLDMIPYIATIVVLVISTSGKSKKYLPPGNLGEAYFREER